MASSADSESIRSWLSSLQASILAGLRAFDDSFTLAEDTWERPNCGGDGRTLALFGGELWEKAGVNFSHVRGDQLPPSASARKPELAGSAFEAMGVSVIVHPRNPYVPTTHLNVRFFTTVPAEAGGEAAWWFGGGFDLTPYYPFEADAVGWHSAAQAALEPFGSELYPRFKQTCDDYFYLPHRDETRGVGGLFFDDFDELGFSDSYAMTRAVGEAFWPAYAAIASRRASLPYAERERSWQKYRRGRYVEFNLLYDRGTLFGLQSKGRTESILVSLPPDVSWHYQYAPEPGSPEAALSAFLRPRAWL
ncbi:MAG: oxygen-dependent coproporphyrinogen oxidase [Opitutales bacterium]